MGEMMIQPSDVKARLRLLRYGLVVIVIVTFLVSLLAPYISLRFVSEAGINPPPITDFLGTALLFTVVVAVIAAAVYFVYQRVLTQTMAKGGDQ